MDGWLAGCMTPPTNTSMSLMGSAACPCDKIIRGRGRGYGLGRMGGYRDIERADRCASNGNNNNNSQTNQLHDAFRAKQAASRPQKQQPTTTTPDTCHHCRRSKATAALNRSRTSSSSLDQLLNLDSLTLSDHHTCGQHQPEVAGAASTSGCSSSSSSQHNGMFLEQHQAGSRAADTHQQHWHPNLAASHHNNNNQHHHHHHHLPDHPAQQHQHLLNNPATGDVSGQFHAYADPHPHHHHHAHHAHHHHHHHPHQHQHSSYLHFTESSYPPPINAPVISHQNQNQNLQHQDDAHLSVSQQHQQLNQSTTDTFENSSASYVGGFCQAAETTSHFTCDLVATNAGHHHQHQQQPDSGSLVKLDHSLDYGSSAPQYVDLDDERQASQSGAGYASSANQNLPESVATINQYDCSAASDTCQHQLSGASSHHYSHDHHHHDHHHHHHSHSHSHSHIEHQQHNQSGHLSDTGYFPSSGQPPTEVEVGGGCSAGPNSNGTNSILHHRGGGHASEPELRVCEWDNCGHTFIDMQEFVQHLEERHVRLEPREKNRYFCLWSNCKRNEQEFNARYKLLIHMRVHSGEKPYTCQSGSCKKSFSRLENLKIHVRSHTGEKPYKCNFNECPKSFTNSSDRIKHHKTHRDPKPYTCSQEGCTKRYTDPSSLRKHQRAHRRVQLAPARPQAPPTCAANCPADFDPAIVLEQLDASQHYEYNSAPPANHHAHLSRSWCAGAAHYQAEPHFQPQFEAHFEQPHQHPHPHQQHQFQFQLQPTATEQQHETLMHSMPMPSSAGQWNQW